MSQWMKTGSVLGAGAAAVLCMAMAAQAQDRGVYAEIGAAQVMEDDFDTTGVIGRIGYAIPSPRQVTRVIDTFAVESELFYGVSGEEFEDNFGVVDSEIEYIISGSFRASKTFFERLDAFARLGFSYASAEAESNSQFDAFDNEETDSDILVGVGGKVPLDPGLIHSRRLHDAE